MTDYDVSDDTRALVEDADLPRRLKDEVYRTIEDRDATTEQVEEIVTAVQAQYEDSRVDPLDPVGTVSAQSIGEPGTQMSVPADERVMIRRNGETDVTEIGPFVDGLLSVRESAEVDGHEVANGPAGVEVLSLRADERVEWKPLEQASRHTAPDEMLEFELSSGRSITATKSHSFVTRKDNEVVPIAGNDLSEGDWLPVARSFDASGPDNVPLKDHLPSSEYWFTSALTDGGAVSEQPGGTDQIRNKKQALAAGQIQEGWAYPVQGTNGLPEDLPLDRETGFFIGAFLAEGNLTDYYVSVSNVDETFQERVRQFADRFGLSLNEYENESGYATGHDIRVNGKILADFIRETCYQDGQKVVPGFAFGAPTPFARGLLEAYFSGDGNVSKRAIRASSRSEMLAKDISLLLARFDIHTTLGSEGESTTLRIPTKYVSRFADRVGMVGKRGKSLMELVESVDPDGPDSTDQIPNFGESLKRVASDAGKPSREFNSAHNRQRIGRTRLVKLLEDVEETDQSEDFRNLQQAVSSDVVWERIESIETVEPEHEFVYDFSVAGLETFTTAEAIVTHNTMNTFHYAGVAEIDVTQGLPRLIELVDARKEPDTPMMTVHLADEYATNRERAHEVVWNIEATKILQLGDVSTNVADMLVQVSLNEETLMERWPTEDDPTVVADEIAEQIESALGVETTRRDLLVEFGPEQPSYRDLLQLVEELREIVFKGIEGINRVVIRKEQLEEGEEFVLYTEGSDFGAALDIEGVDASRTTCNNIHEIHSELGIEAARESIIEETMNTLEEQGLDDVNIRHLMLVADIMTNNGEIESIGRHGISGSKESVLARAAFEVTVNHLLDAAIHGEVDDLNGVTENVIVGKPIKLGTGDVDLRMTPKSD